MRRDGDAAGGFGGVFEGDVEAVGAGEVVEAVGPFDGGDGAAAHLPAGRVAIGLPADGFEVFEAVEPVGVDVQKFRPPGSGGGVSAGQ